MIRVLIDTCLLVKGNVCNVLLDFGKARLISLHWTPEIGRQFLKNWAKRRVSSEASIRKAAGKPPMSRDELSQLREVAVEKAQSRLDKLELLTPEWRIPGWNLPAAVSAYPEASVCIAGRGGEVIHPKDYEVALAAIKLAEVFPDDEVWLASENIHHLPPSEMAKYRVWSIHQGVLAEELYRQQPDRVRSSLEFTLSQTGRAGQAKLSKLDMINIFDDPRHFGSPYVARRLLKAWNISPTA